MPRKKNRKIFDKKQIQKIRTRLIELSMKVDDFVYNKIPISEPEARNFIIEVNAYKVECNEDERSLQVIEKLNRCMKAIIAEHEEQELNDQSTNNDNSYMDDVRAGSVSPVYSLFDEDRTQFTQEVPGSPVNANAMCNVSEVSNEARDMARFTQATPLNVTDSSDKVIKTIDLCDDDGERSSEVTKSCYISKSIKTTDFIMQKALSNLSLKDVDPDEINSTYDQSSQSILGNFKDIHTVVQSQTIDVNRNKLTDTDVDYNKAQNHDPYLNNSIKIVKPTSVLNTNNKRETPSNSYNINDLLLSKVSNAIKKTINSKSITNATQIAITKSKNETEKNTRTATNMINNKQQASKPVKKNNNIPFVPKEISPAKFLKQSDAKGKKAQKFVDEIKHPVAKKKIGRPKKKNTQIKTNVNRILTQEEINTSESISQTSKTAPKRKRTNNKKNPPVPIYNKNVENDLSWLEGIRYVREICEDEYDRNMDINEDFWDNYYLPSNFDDNDFVI